MKRGLLVKDGSALERLAEIDLALFDKTGTLTLGEPRADIAALNDQQRAIALGLAQHSRHPLSKGLAATLRMEGVEPAAIDDPKEKEGRGIAGTWQGTTVSLEKPEGSFATLASVLQVGDDRKLIAFTDPLREDVAQTLTTLGAMGIGTSIVSGDRQSAVDEVGRAMGLPGKGDVSPAEKLAMLEAAKAEGGHPLMIGDGLNDGPALAAAHASIAPGTASDISQQAADAVFVGEKLMPVALAVRVARSTMRIVKQNFGFAILYNVLAVPLALAGFVTPLVAAIAMSASSLVVVANSLRLARSAS